MTRAIGSTAAATLVAVVVWGTLALAQTPQPTCKGCPATYIGDAEIDAYLARAKAERIIDQQVGRSMSANRTSRSAWCTAPRSPSPAKSRNTIS